MDNYYTIIAGPNGCGKSTQGKRLAGFLPEAIHSDMSFLIGQKLNEQSFRDEHAEALAEGDLLPCNVVNGIFREHSEKIEYTNHILTGFPRTVAQVFSFMKYLSGKYGDGYAIDHVNIFILHMTVDDAIERTKKRVAQAREAGLEVRKDDLNEFGEVDEDKIRHRYLLYNTETVPALDYFRHLGLPVLEIDATLKIHEIQARILQTITQKQRAVIA